MRQRFLLALLTGAFTVVYAACAPQNSSSETTSEGAEQVAQTSLQTYDETASGIPVTAQYPSDTMEAMGLGSGEGVGVFFTFQPQGTHLDDAEVHVFLPAGTTTAAEQEAFITGPGGLAENNGWVIDSTGSAEFTYPWVEQVFNFSTDREESGHILLGQTAGQAVQVTLLYPAEMANAYWPSARVVLDSLAFDAGLLPITSSEGVRSQVIPSSDANLTTDTAPTSQRPTQLPSSIGQATRDISVQRVQFAPGATSAVVENSITGYEIIDYVLNAQAGQYANISMATDNAANYFNILAPGETEVAIFNSSSSGNQYEGTLPESGDYRIRVYLMRSAARRNEVANYRLEMIVSGQGSMAQGNGALPPSSGAHEGDARVPGTGYHATGNIVCAMTQQEPSRFCPFGVVREGNGSGFVEVTKPNGSRVSIYFQNGQAVGSEGSSGEFSAARQGDETLVYIGDERYVIPDAVIFGG
ncbi:MAG: hypothetical protein ACFB8W_14250 [Elainellaceae cyanobacterium]